MEIHRTNLPERSSYQLLYLYKHIRLDNNEVFYIGFGNKNRPHSKWYRNNSWEELVKETKYKVEILIESNDRQYLKKKEREYISLYGRKDLGLGTLVNRNDGGDGGNLCKETINKAVEKRRNTINSMPKKIRPRKIIGNLHKETIALEKFAYELFLIGNKKLLEMNEPES